MSDELTLARETIRRLNRRVQSAESGLAEKINENAGRSLGRAFANAAATMYAAQLVDANETIGRQCVEIARLRETALTGDDIGFILSGEFGPRTCPCSHCIALSKKLDRLLKGSA